MSPSVLMLFRLLLLQLAGCVGTTAPPAVVLQLNQIVRARTTDGWTERRSELVFSAALSIGLETVIAMPVEPQALDPPLLEPDAHSCEPLESSLCVWMRTAEESAWLAMLEHLEILP